MIAVDEAINVAVNLYASGTTQVDAGYGKRSTENFTRVEPLNPEDDDGGHHENKGSAKVRVRQRLPERPLGENGRANTVTAAWDTIGLHDEWANGIPLLWSKETAGKNVNTHFQKLVRKRKLNPDNYDLVRFDSDGQPKISPESVDRALVPRRQKRTEQSGNSAGN
jgi:hypothetical protein